MMHNLLVGTILVIGSALASAAPRECQLAVHGIAHEGGGCAGVTICVDGPSDACALRGPVIARLGRRRALRLLPVPGAQCVTAMQADDDNEMTVKISARAGRRRGRHLRMRSAVTCSATLLPPDGQCSGLTVPMPIVGRRAQFPPSIQTD